jgi:enoyl-CoA hydratase/carnithine racemase
MGGKMDYKNIIYQKKEGVAKITLNRPEVLNCLNKAMVIDIGNALDDADKDDSIGTIVITGSGRAFCTGMDLKFAKEELNTIQAQHDFFIFANEIMMRKLEKIRKPVIAGVNGLAIAGGFELLLNVDLVIAAEDAVIGDYHMQRGLLAAGGAYFRLPLLIGLRRAKELMFTGKTITSKEAEQIGLVNSVVPQDMLESVVDSLAKDLAEKSPVAMKIAKSLINNTVLVDAEARLELILMSALVGSASGESEGLKAFYEKRKPEFKDS